MNKTIIICGLPHNSPKIARHYKVLGISLGVNPIIYSRDVTKHSSKVADEYKVSWEEVPKGCFRDVQNFFFLLAKHKPSHVELYFDTQSDLVLYGYLLLLRAFKIPLITICRGSELLLWDNHSIRRKAMIRSGLMASKLILYKELYMPEQLRKLRISSRKIHFFHNRVPIKQEKPILPLEAVGVLYLNSWRTYRRPDIAVEVGLRLAGHFPNVIFTVGGERYWCSEKFSRAEFESQIKDAGVERQVIISKWVLNPDELLTSNNIFLLPAGQVFVNYTLIEAMERGLVPVIARVKGAEKIVEHGENGLIVDLSAAAFTEAVEYLLSNPTILQQMSVRARKKVINSFNLQRGLQDLVKTYKSMLPKT